MTDAPVRGLRPEKRAALTSAGRAAFAREGYARASVQRIADAAGVSTRTLYKHFPGKAALFAAILTDSAREVADDFDARIDAIASDADAERTLTAVARALVDHRLEHPEHFAMSETLDHDRDHVDDDQLAAWHAAGPERVERRVADVLAGLQARGLLRDADPGAAASQLILLVAGAVAFAQRPVAARLAREEAGAIVVSGVDTFLYGFAPRG